MKIFHYVSTALVAIVLVGCDGEARPFEEAVEVRSQNLTEVIVVPPTISVDELVMNFGETAQFGVEATSVIGQTIELESNDRDWQVTDESIATINDQGQLTAIANGDVGVFISIGGLISDAYELRVSDSTLAAVTEISGESTIERCLPEDYQAVGTFEDGTERDLSAVTWSLATADADNARVVNNPDTTVTVTGVNNSLVTLTAAVSDLSNSLPITVSGTLSEIVISPSSGSVDVDDVASFAAFGTYIEDAVTDDGTAAQREENITESVDWVIESGTAFASVSNIDGERGEVTGLEAGTSTLSANCGDLPSTRINVVVSESSDSDSDGLAFSQGDTETLEVGDSSILLRVSTGSVFNSDDELEQDELTWELSLDDSSSPAISLQDEDSGTNAGRITPLAEGGATVTVTDDDGSSASIRIEVTDN